jgi:SAM-dependent methyltransferase
MGLHLYMTRTWLPAQLPGYSGRCSTGLFGASPVTVALLMKFCHICQKRFDGVLLDVPVGTGLFTCSRYAGFPDATIVAVDYSMGMLQQARKRFLEHGVNNVHLFRADVANLPVTDGAFDIVLSMAGLHAFRDKRGAIKEMRRVLREQGTLLADCYVRGVRRRADWVIKHILVRRAYVSPPFLHIDTIASELEGFTIRQQGNFECCAWFEAVKDEVAESCKV